MDGQDLRRQSNPETASKIDVICQQLESFANGDHSFTIELRDPSGNSFIETPFPSIDHDDLLKRTFYERTAEEARFLGLVVQGSLSAFMFSLVYEYEMREKVFIMEPMLVDLL